MKTKWAASIALVLCFYTLEAQNYGTRQLEYLYGLMNCSLPKQSEIFYCHRITNLPLLVNYDETGAVTHLGISIFSNSLKEFVGKPVCDFQERLFLELFLQGSEEKARKLMEEYKVEYPFLFGGGAFFNSLENSLQFATNAKEYVLTKDSLTWESAWYDSTQYFSLRFPSNFDLILGMDKKEAEIWLANQLQLFKSKGITSTPLVIDSDELEQLNPSLYRLSGKKLFTKGMNSNLYFEKNADSLFSLIYDRNFPEESIVNLFNHPDTQAVGLDLQIRQIVYGGGAKTLKIKLSDFQSFMGSDYEIYTGIEKCTADVLEFSVMYKSKYYNCSHLLFVQTIPHQLFEKTAPLSAIFYTFIPNNNIPNLYKEYLDNREIPIDINK